MKKAGIVVFTFWILLLADNVTSAAGGSWGGSRGWGSGGCWGGSIGYPRTPVRNLVRGVGRHFVGGCRGGCWGGSRGVYYANTGWSCRGGSYGCWGGSRGTYLTSMGSNGGSYGCWGTSYVSTTVGSVGSPYSPYSYSTPAYSYPLSTDVGMPTNLVYPVEGTIINADSVPGLNLAPGSITPQYYEPRTIPGSPLPPTEQPADPTPTPQPAEDGETSVRRWQNDGESVLNIRLPVQAQVYVNGRLTKTEGGFRSYVARQLQRDGENVYHLKAVLERDGRQLTRSESVDLQLGYEQTVTFDFDKPAVTTVAVQVPTDATVKLCGRETDAVGTHRSFKTTGLPDGETWEDYQVVVSVVRNGKTETKQQRLDVAAGETYSLKFDFQLAGEQIATR